MKDVPDCGEPSLGGCLWQLAGIVLLLTITLCGVTGAFVVADAFAAWLKGVLS